MTKQMISNGRKMVEKIHEETIDGRRVIITHHKLTCDKSEKPYYTLLEWYCGYVQILNKDNIYPSVSDYAREGGKNDPDVDFDSAPITMLDIFHNVSGTKIWTISLALTRITIKHRIMTLRTYSEFVKT